jgi:hypothetical protein
MLTAVRKIRTLRAMKVNKMAVEMAPTWARKIGRRQAVRRLIATDLFAATTAFKICSGTYKSTLSDERADVMVREMLSDGFSLNSEKAS